MALLPLFLVRCPDLYRRTLVAYTLAIAASLVVFVVVPVTSTGLRIDPGTLDPRRFASWAVALVYRVDPPYNLFPSLHLSIALLAAGAAWKAKRAYGVAALAGGALIAVSICTVKQHFVLDAAGAAALSAGIYTLVLRPYTPRPAIDPAYGWRGPAAYAGVLAAAYLGLYAGFRLSS
jgi:membrane-associated phospholipid phosphatase